MLTAVHLWKNDSFLDQSAFLCFFLRGTATHLRQEYLGSSRVGVDGVAPVCASGSGYVCTGVPPAV